MMTSKGGTVLNTKKWLVVTGFIVLVWTAANFIPQVAMAYRSSSLKTITLYLGGERLSPEIKAIQKNTYSYINLPFLTKLFPVTCDWDSDQGVISFKYGELNFKMHEGRTTYYVNGGKRYLTVAPFVRNGQLWLPLQFLLRLGLVIKGRDRRRLYLDWNHNYLLGIENIKYEERPALLLAGTKQLKIKHFLLKEPNRLVIDLAGVTAHFAMGEISVENPVIAKVRIHQFDKDQLRLVFDLKKAAGYKIIQAPEQNNRAILVFNYLVEAIGFYQDIDRKVSIKTSYPAFYQVETANQSGRLVIDLKGATLGDKVDSVPSDGKWLGSARIIQSDPQTVQVILDFLCNESCFVVRSADDPNRIEIRSQQQISAVNWVCGDSGGKLIIQSTGEIVNTVQKLHNPEQLQIELQCAKFLPIVQTPEIKDEQVKGIRLITDPSNNVKILVDLANYAGYNIITSTDRRNLIVSFRESPIINKVVVIDAGHGGVDLGACGRQGTREKDINLEVSMRLKDLLEGAGAEVVLTRGDDEYISLYERGFMANYLPADLFISVHTNNHTDLSVQGIEVYHYPGRLECKLLAEKVIDSLVFNTGLIGLGVKVNDFVVIRETQMPGILVELGYLSNYQEETIIKTTGFTEKAALGIFEGIIDYYKANQVEIFKLSQK
jgi:N-acetylmuramoyl-L-alanine amidase